MFIRSYQALRGDRTNGKKYVLNYVEQGLQPAPSPLLHLKSPQALKEIKWLVGFSGAWGLEAL